MTRTRRKLAADLRAVHPQSDLYQIEDAYFFNEFMRSATAFTSIATARIKSAKPFIISPPN